MVDKLLHAPTVRVKELAGSPGGQEYAAALRVLFDLDPRAVEAVTRAAPELITSNGSGGFSIKNQYSGLFVDASANTQKTDIVQATGTGGSSQAWEIQ